MFGELFKDIRDAVSEVRHGTPPTTLTFAKPYCAPARGIIEPVLAKYGVKVYAYSEGLRMANPLTLLAKESKLDPRAFDDMAASFPLQLPTAQVAKVTVSEKAAAWAEYLLLRTNQVYRVGRYINKRNEAWAARHGGQMPPAWHEGKPWIERTCSEGVNAWQQVKEAAKQGVPKGTPPTNERQTGRKLTKGR